MFDPVRWDVRCIGTADQDSFPYQSEWSERTNRLNDNNVGTAAETAIARTAVARIVRGMGREKAFWRCNRVAGEDLRAGKQEQNECSNAAACSPVLHAIPHIATSHSRFAPLT